MLNVCVFGAAGRMGRSLVEGIFENPNLTLTGALLEPGDPLTGRDIGEVAGLDALDVLATDQPARALDGAQVAIDFTLPVATFGNINACEEAGVAMVTGTTGLSEDQWNRLQGRDWKIPAMFAPNMSIGVNLMYGLVAQAAQSLGVEYDIEVIETHHRHKKDAPSGTALKLGKVLADALNVDLAKQGVFTRQGEAPRRSGDIGFSVVRAGDVVGDHTVLFATEGERLEITHKASSRQTFVAGALRACPWVVQQPPGFYGMGHVLG
ncbi:MAG: 4-hydroxy-tetrahydrodipicolinate reductase, partial [Pseudomonadota bacterium]